MNREIRVFASATVSNIACGFDIMGFSINRPGDEVVIRISPEPGVRIVKITGDDGRLPKDPLKNTAGKPLISMIEKLGLKTGLEVDIHKKMPFGSGLGSSAASAVAATFALDRLLELNLPREELLLYAIEGEKIASGSVHADNVAPALYGGFTLIRGYNPPDVVEIDVPENIYCTILHPDIEISTSESRSLLPREIPLKDAITQWGNTAGLIAGLLKSDYALISRSLQDVVAEPVRTHLIPGFKEIKKAALVNGALGCSISGSGPAIFALSASGGTASTVGEAMYQALLRTGLSGEIFVSQINREGPKVLYLK